MANQRRIATLSFASEHKGEVDLWVPTETTGSYSSDNDLGRSRADELVQYMRDNQAPMTLGHVVGAIMKRGNYGAIEIGFFNQLALLSMRGFAGTPLVNQKPEPEEPSQLPPATGRDSRPRPGVELLH